ncbi:unnamed protein product [Candida verbasci]|uniref:ferric-chelate reductase (NADPH) n=1 Tax=Candida verbasci TaxID=1227364 RepID=A0A9W4TZM4_9ASCO|nr:unnamed protein product [Candida verbasci]
MGVSYQGLDCLADMSNSTYMMYQQLSQTEIPWADQSNYAKYTIYFGIVTIFISTLKNAYYRFRDSTYLNTRSSNKFSSIVDVLISYCRFVGYKQVPKYLTYLSFPNSVGSTLYMMISALYLFCYCLVPHFWYRGCAGFGSPPLAVRAGMMATALTPFIYILAGKSNAITLLTGISYEKLNVYHQYVGVCTLVLSIIHTIPFIHQDLVEGGSGHLHMNFISDRYYYSGIPPLILLGLLCTLSKAWIRKHIYEFFLHSHWMFGIAYFGTLIWHIDKSLDADDYMWGALAFWATQLIYRILIKTAFKPNSMFLKSRPAIMNQSGDNVYEIVIEKVKDYKWAPGQHCFLRFADLSILDSHPFSIASIKEDEQGMRFIVIPKKGLTKSHFEELNTKLTCEKKVFIDGPYGGTFRNIESFERVVLIASGSGVTATLPFLSYLSKHNNILKYVSFIWIVRKTEDVNWIDEKLKECQKLLGNKLDIQLHVCEKEVDEKYIENDLQYIYDKPSVKKIITNLVNTLTTRNMFICSGSDSMKREVSKSVSELQSLIFNNDYEATNIEEIYLHTESFGW